MPADNIPEAITADLTGLDFNDSLHISAIPLPQGSRPTNPDKNFTVASIAPPLVAAEEPRRGGRGSGGRWQGRGRQGGPRRQGRSGGQGSGRQEVIVKAPLPPHAGEGSFCRVTSRQSGAIFIWAALESSAMLLFVGLGNPGREYAKNRHNIGFMAIEAIARKHGFSPPRAKFQGLLREGTIGGERVLLLQPQTYMNESGRSVGEAARFHKIGLNEIIVFHDELDLAPAKMRIKIGGGDAGHNGLRSISAHMGAGYKRIRLGHRPSRRQGAGSRLCSVGFRQGGAALGRGAVRRAGRQRRADRRGRRRRIAEQGASRAGGGRLRLKERESRAIMKFRAITLMLSLCAAISPVSADIPPPPVAPKGDSRFRRRQAGLSRMDRRLHDLQEAGGRRASPAPPSAAACVQTAPVCSKRKTAP